MSSVEADILPEHELINPNNQLGQLITILIHDPELEFIDLIEALVAENAASRPSERRAYLLDEIKNYVPGDEGS